MKILYLSYERNLDLENEHEVIYWDCNMGQKLDLIDLISSSKPDIIIEREWHDSTAVYSEMLEGISIPKAVWLIDTHCSFANRKEFHLEYAKNYDFIFLAISKYVDEFKDKLGHDRVFWLPLCYPNRIDSIRDNDEPKKYDISFIGQWQHVHRIRSEYIERLKKYYGDMFYCATDYNPQTRDDIVRKSKIAFNCALDGDLNFRVFESTGAGTLCLTDDVPDIWNVPELAAHILIYKDFDHCVNLINTYIEASEIRERAAREAQDFIRQRHCLYHRHIQMLDTIGL